MKPLIDPINTDDGQFHGRDNQTGALATIVTPGYMNDTQGATRSLQREIISVLTAAGMKPAEAADDQLFRALKDLFLAADDGRVRGALQKADNLADVADRAASLAHLGGVSARRKINGHALTGDLTLTTQDTFAQAQAIGDGADLSTLTAPGLYYQQYNVQAGTGRHYPVPLAGALTVLKHAGITQVYRVYHDSRCFVRSCYEGDWSDWVQGYDTQNPPSAGETGAYTKEESHARFLALTGGTVSGAVRFEKGLAVETDITGGPWGKGGLWEAARQAVRQSATFSAGASGDSAGHLNPWWWHQDHRTGLLTQGGIVSRTGDRTRVVFPKGFSHRCRGVQLTLTGSALGSEGIRDANIYATEADLNGFTYCARRLETEAYWLATGE